MIQRYKCFVLRTHARSYVSSEQVYVVSRQVERKLISQIRNVMLGFALAALAWNFLGQAVEFCREMFAKAEMIDVLKVVTSRLDLFVVV